MIWKKSRNVSTNFRKISHPEQGIFLFWSNFSKEVSQLIDRETYKKFGHIWILCTNIPKMSIINFRKISYPELDISLYLSISVRK